MADDQGLFVVLDRHGCVERFGSDWEQVARWSPATTVGRPLAELLVPLEPAQYPLFGATDVDLQWRGLVAVNPCDGGFPTPLRASLAAAAGATELRLEAEPLPATGIGGGAEAQGGTAAAPSRPAAATLKALTARSFREAPAHANEQRLGLLLGHMPGFCYSVDERLVFTASAGAGLTPLSLVEDQLVGVCLCDLYGTRDPTYEPLACHLRALAGSPQTYQDVCMGRSLEYHIQPLRDPEGRIVGVVGVSQDVTEREAMKEALATVHAQLRQAQKLETIGQLAGGVAHDFNNQLTCILGNIALALPHLPAGSRALRHLTDAAGAAESAAALTRHLLALGRKQVVEPRAIELGALVGRVQSMLRRLVEARITLRVEASEGRCPVYADPGQVEQILINLVVNARDAIHENGEITIATRAHDCTPACEHPTPELDTGRYAVLTVEDDGSGMSDAVRARVFEPYFTTKPIGEGTGLGLTTVLGLVEQNHGFVTVDSALGRGSRFQIYLPRLADDAVAATGPLASGAARPGAPPELPRGTEVILLVDDEPLVLEMATCALQQLGYEVIPCGSADEALRRFEERGRRVDLLVTDVVMPRLNGRELAARIGALRPGLPILFTSGYGENTIARHGVFEPGVNFLGKPYRPFELAAKIRALLDAARPSPPPAAGP